MGVSQKHTIGQKLSFGISAVLIGLTLTMIIAFGGKEMPTEKAAAHGAEIAEIKLQRVARDISLSNLKDPDSAKFRDQVGACGEVNAKNSMGGYTGCQRFIATSRELEVIEGMARFLPMFLIAAP